jgi:hypothetical protein
MKMNEETTNKLGKGQKRKGAQKGHDFYGNGHVKLDRGEGNEIEKLKEERETKRIKAIELIDKLLIGKYTINLDGSDGISHFITELMNTDAFKKALQNIMDAGVKEGKILLPEPKVVETIVEKEVKSIPKFDIPKATDAELEEIIDVAMQEKLHRKELAKQEKTNELRKQENEARREAFQRQ